MPTFAGRYVTEPSDLKTVCSESTIIGVCDESGGPEARGVQVFADLTVDELAAIVGVMNTMIRRAEGMLESAARRRGYAIPLEPIDDSAIGVVAQVVWISMRLHAGRLTGAAAGKEYQAIKDGDLLDIAEGRLLLTATRNTATSAPGGHFYSMTSAHQRDTTGRTPRLSRKALEVF